MLKRQEGYMLKKIEDVYSLLPFGQSVADQRKGISMNETGVFLWNALKEPKEEEELIELTASHYDIRDDEERAQLKKDIREFTEQLLAYGILRREWKDTFLDKKKNCKKEMQIAGMKLGFLGESVETLLPEQFTPFMTGVSEVNVETATTKKFDQFIELAEYYPERRQNGKVLIRNRELIISEWEEGYMISFPSMHSIHEAYMTEDGRYVKIYCRRPKEEEKDELFHAIRLFFLYLAQKNGYYAIHSASILYKGKAWLFSGHSGMGKSTHTAMWHDLLGTPYLNGDLNLVGKKDGKLTVSGIPWCGTSEIYTTKDYELGGIVLLGRDTKDHVEVLSEYEKTMRVMQRMISPVWKEELLLKNLECAEELAKGIPVLHLFCTKEPSAVETVKAEMDRIIKESNEGLKGLNRDNAEEHKESEEKDEG